VASASLSSDSSSPWATTLSSSSALRRPDVADDHELIAGLLVRNFGACNGYGRSRDITSDS
jgi:hypothetical protein